MNKQVGVVEWSDYKPKTDHVFVPYKIVDDRVPIEKLLLHLGISRRDTICCPFHRETKPSLKIYGGSKGWFCFGCLHGGGAIEFFALFHKISIQESIKQLCKIFNICSDNFLDIAAKHGIINTNVNELTLRGIRRQLYKDYSSVVFAEKGKRREVMYDGWMNYGINLIHNMEFVSQIYAVRKRLDEFFLSLLDAWKNHEECQTDKTKSTDPASGDAEILLAEAAADRTGSPGKGTKISGGQARKGNFKLTKKADSD